MKKLVVLFMVLALSVAALATRKQIVVKFKPGTSSASYKGSIKLSDAKGPGELHDSYTLGASKGQIMTVDATATGPVSVYVWQKSKGFNQGYLLNSKGDRKVHVRFRLPANDDYVVNIERAGTETDIDYDVKFSIR